jgi:hypothetical protein
MYLKPWIHLAEVSTYFGTMVRQGGDWKKDNITEGKGENIFYLEVKRWKM